MTPAVACPRCRQPVLPGAQFCPSCGLDVSGPQGNLTTAQVPPGTAPRDAEAELLRYLHEATLGDYDIVGELGRGGMATVYLAHDIALDRKVAIKVMRPGLFFGEGMVDRFKREARTAAALTHPHIIPIHLVRETPHILFFVMKYVEGRGLDSILAEQGQLPVQMARTILTQVGGALVYAHRHGTVHRDVKPANILIDTDGWAVVTDFGIAKVAEGGSLTQSGTTVGTPPYMSPEQCSARPVTGASDQYSLGIVAFEMLAGRPPFAGDSLMDIMRMHFFEPPPPLAQWRPDCPPALAAAVTRMLAKDPGGRWPTLADAIRAIGVGPQAPEDPVRTQMSALAKTGIKPVARISAPVSPTPVARPAPARPPPARPALRPPRPAAPPRPRRPRRRWRALAWGSAVVVIGAAAALVIVPQLRQPGAAENSAAPPAAFLPDSVTGLEITGAPESLVTGQTVMLDARATNARGGTVPGAAIVWSGGDPAVARVWPRGVIMAVGAGSALVVATSGDARDSVQIAVLAPAPPAPPPETPTPRAEVPARPVTRPPAVAEIVVTPPSLRMEVGDSARLRAEARDAAGRALSGRAVRWETSDARIAAVSGGGVVHAAAPGTVSITASVAGAPATHATIVVTAPVPPVPGVLRLLITPWANLTVDGRSRGQRDRFEDSVSAAVPHRLRFERPGFVTLDTTVTLDPGETRLVRIQLRRSP